MRILRLCLTVLLFFALMIPVCAEETLPDTDFSALREQIPEEVLSLLPEEIFVGEITSEKAEAFADSVGDGIFDCVFDALGANLPRAARSLSVILGTLILAAAYKAFAENLGGRSSAAVSFAVTLSLVLTLYNCEKEIFTSVGESLKGLCAVMDTLCPIYAAITAAGGSAAAATAESYCSVILLALCDSAGVALLLPVLKVSFGLLLCSAAEPRNTGISGVGRGVRQLFSLALTLLTTLVLSVMGVKTLLASSTDSLAAKTAKLAIGQAVPVVGGAIGDSVSALAAGISVIKSTAGALGILLILLLTLPGVITLALNRGILAFSSAAAGILGCEREKKILDEAAELTGLAIGITAVCSLAFFLATVIFLSVKLPYGV